MMNRLAVAPIPTAPTDTLAVGIESLEGQSRALCALAHRIGSEFEQAVALILAGRGRTVLCGMGKSGLIGRKIAATLASTGTPSFFLHPAEAVHGDLGMLTPEDLVVLISYSGETEELVKLLPSLQQFGNRLIGMTGNPLSTLGKRCDVVLEIEVEREVCPNNLAPTTSTLVTLALGDALACALIKARDFKALDFAKFHPGGRLGRKLLTRVGDLMRAKDLPIVRPDVSVRESLFVMTQGRLGVTLVMEDEQLLGIVTDGDLRRAYMGSDDLMNAPIEAIMTPNPVTIRAHAKLSQAEEIMREKKIKLLVVTDEGNRVVGLLEIFHN